MHEQASRPCRILLGRLRPLDLPKAVNLRLLGNIVKFTLKCLFRFFAQLRLKIRRQYTTRSHAGGLRYEAAARHFLVRAGHRQPADER